MIDSVSRITIARPAGNVWSVIDDFDGVAAWLEYTPALTLTSSAPKGVGSTLRYVFTQGGRVSAMEGTVTAYVPGELLTMRFQDTMADVEVAFAVKSAGGGCEVEHRISIAPRKFLMRLFTPLIRMGNGGQVRRNLERLRRVCEH